MKIILLISILFFSVKILSQNQYLSKKDRSFFSNEIFFSGTKWFDPEYYNIGIGYERTVFRLKGNKKDYLSWQNELMYALPNRQHSRFQYSIIQSLFKFNRLDKYSIYSLGVGGASIHDSQYFNSVLFAGYKYFIKRSKVTIALNCQFGYQWRGQISDTTVRFVTGSFLPTLNETNWHFWGGITIGKYF